MAYNKYEIKGLEKMTETEDLKRTFGQCEELIKSTKTLIHSSDELIDIIEYAATLGAEVHLFLQDCIEGELWESFNEWRINK